MWHRQIDQDTARIDRAYLQATILKRTNGVVLLANAVPGRTIVSFTASVPNLLPHSLLLLDY
jgi:hypothetical protein